MTSASCFVLTPILSADDRSFPPRYCRAVNIRRRRAGIARPASNSFRGKVIRFFDPTSEKNLLTD